MKGNPEELRAFWELWEQILPKLLVVCQRFFLGCELSHNVGEIRTEKGEYSVADSQLFWGPENHQISPKKFATFPPIFFFFFFKFPFLFQICEIRWVG
jgi:hypothetical protein